MDETARLDGVNDCFEVGFVEQEVTPESGIKLGIRLHLAGLSLSNTIFVLERMRVDRCRSTVHNRIQKKVLQTADGADLEHVAVDETVMQLDDKQYWLFATIDPDTNRLLHVQLFLTRTQALSEMYFAELREKHRLNDAVFLVDGAPWLQAACHRHRLRFRHETHGNRNSVKHFFREVKCRTNQFANCFSHADAQTVENWLQAYAFLWYQLT